MAYFLSRNLLGRVVCWTLIYSFLIPPVLSRADDPIPPSPIEKKADAPKAKNEEESEEDIAAKIMKERNGGGDTTNSGDKASPKDKLKNAKPQKSAAQITKEKADKEAKEKEEKEKAEKKKKADRLAKVKISYIVDREQQDQKAYDENKVKHIKFLWDTNEMCKRYHSKKGEDDYGKPCGMFHQAFYCEPGKKECENLIETAIHQKGLLYRDWAASKDDLDMSHNDLWWKYEGNPFWHRDLKVVGTEVGALGAFMLLVWGSSFLAKKDPSKMKRLVWLQKSIAWVGKMRGVKYAEDMLNKFFRPQNKAFLIITGAVWGGIGTWAFFKMRNYWDSSKFSKEYNQRKALLWTLDTSFVLATQNFEDYARGNVGPSSEGPSKKDFDADAKAKAKKKSNDAEALSELAADLKASGMSDDDINEIIEEAKAEREKTEKELADVAAKGTDEVQIVLPREVDLVKSGGKFTQKGVESGYKINVDFMREALIDFYSRYLVEDSAVPDTNKYLR